MVACMSMVLWFYYLFIYCVVCCDLTINRLYFILLLWIRNKMSTLIFANKRVAYIYNDTWQSNIMINNKLKVKTAK